MVGELGLLQAFSLSALRGFNYHRHQENYLYNANTNTCIYNANTNTYFTVYRPCLQVVHS